MFLRALAILAAVCYLGAENATAAISSTSATSDSTNLYYQFTYSGTPRFFRAYLDTDKSASTGFAVNGIGANYLLENGNLYRYSGSNGAWGWSSVKTIPMTNSNLTIRWTVAKTDVGSPAGVNVLFQHDNPTTTSAVLSQTITAPVSNSISLSVAGAPNLPYNGTSTLVTVSFAGATPTKVSLARDGLAAFATWPGGTFFTLSSDSKSILGNWCISASCWGYQSGAHTLSATATYADGSTKTSTVSLNVVTSTPTTTVPPTVTWTRCAQEGGVCSFTGTRQVRYGANGIYAYQTATGSIACSNATFGDPVYGVAKACDYSSVVQSAPVTTTTLRPPTTTTLPSSTGVDISGPVKIAYHGDSTVQGYGLTTPPPIVADNNLPSNFYVRDEGVGGSTFRKLLDGTDSVHAPWVTWIAQSTDHIVIANQALNDINALGSDTATYMSNIRQVVDIARAGGKFVILETPNPTTTGQIVKIYADAMKQVALEKNVPVIDQYSYLAQYLAANNLTINSITYDGVHPNQTGANIKGQFSAKRIKEILGVGTTSPTTTTTLPLPPPTTTTLPSNSTGPTYYLSPNGNDANSGSASAPWRTIQKAANTVSAGATVILMDGTYEEPEIAFRRSGTASAPITIKAQNKWQAIVSSISGCHPGFSMYASHIHVKDLRFSVSSRNANCTTYTSANVHIRAWNSVEPTPSNPTTGYVGFQASGLKVDGLNRAIGIKSNQDFTIIENTEAAHSLELFNGRDSIVRNNVVTGPGAGDPAIFVKGGVRNVQIYNNVVRMKRSNNSAILIGGYSCDLCHFDRSTNIEAYNTVAYNNVVINESGGQITALGFQGAKDSAFFNNVVISGSLSMLLGGHNTGPQAPVSNPTFKNNIVVCNGAPLTSGWSYTGTLSADYNNLYNCSSSLTQAHPIVGNPMFVNQTSDWRLQAGSPAINSGTVVTMPAYGGGTIDISRDFNGVTRTTPWDLGLYNIVP